MKKIIAFILAFLLAFGNIGIGFMEETPAPIDENTIPIVELIESPSPDPTETIEIQVFSQEEETETPSPTPTETPSPTPTATSTETSTATPDVTETPSPTPEVTATPTVTATPEITSTPTSVITETPTPTPTPRPITVTKILRGEIWQVRCDVMDGTSYQAGGGYWKADITNSTNTTSKEGHRSNHCGNWENWVLFVTEDGVANGLYQLKSGSTGGTLSCVIYHPKYNLTKDEIIHVDPTNVTDTTLNKFKQNYDNPMPISAIELHEGNRLWWTTQNGGQVWHHTGILRKTEPRFAIKINGTIYQLGVGESIQLTDVEDGLVQVEEIATANYKLYEVIYNDEGDVTIINEVDDPDRPTAKPPKPIETVTPTSTPTPSPTMTPTPTPTPSPTPTATPSPTPTITPILSPTPTVTTSPTPTHTVIPTATPMVTSSPTPTITPTPIPSPTVTPSPTPTATSIITPSPTPTETPTVTPSPTSTVEPTPTVPPTSTPTLSPTPTPNITPTKAPRPTVKPTPSPTPTVEPTPTPKVDEEGRIWYWRPTPSVPPDKPIPKMPGNWYTIIEDYGIPLGVEVPINHAGDCFD